MSTINGELQHVVRVVTVRTALSLNLSYLRKLISNEIQHAFLHVLLLQLSLTVNDLKLLLDLTMLKQKMMLCNVKLQTKK